MAPLLRWDSICEKVWVDVALITNDYDEPLEHIWAFKDIELMQWTGLKDINGVEIFEGDIVVNDFVGGVDTYVIQRSAATGQLYGAWIDTGEFIDLDDIGDMTIVGNIYENSDLLEVRNDNT